jgi:hypothetical protein
MGGVRWEHVNKNMLNLYTQLNEFIHKNKSDCEQYWIIKMMITLSKDFSEITFE